MTKALIAGKHDWLSVKGLRTEDLIYAIGQALLHRRSYIYLACQVADEYGWHEFPYFEMGILLDQSLGANLTSIRDKPDKPFILSARARWYKGPEVRYYNGMLVYSFRDGVGKFKFFERYKPTPNTKHFGRMPIEHLMHEVWPE